MPTYNLTRVITPLLVMFDEKTVLQMMKDSLDKAGVRAVQFVKDTYPPDPPNADSPSPLHTAKQWRWWWYMMNRIAKGESVPDNLRGWKARYVRKAGHKVLSLSGHYKRTGTLVRSITYLVVSEKGALVLQVGPSMARTPGEGGVAPYAQYVIDRPPPYGHQARIHQGRWIPLEDIIKQYSGQIVKTFLDALMDDMTKRLARHGWLLYGG